MTIAVMPNMIAADIRKAVTFYRDLLGFTQTYQFPPEGEPEYVELRLGDSMVALSTHDAIRGVGLPEPSRGQVLELVVWCEDAGRELAKLRQAGVPVLVEPYRHVAGHLRATVADPDGCTRTIADSQYPAWSPTPCGPTTRDGASPHTSTYVEKPTPR